MSYKTKTWTNISAHELWHIQLTFLWHHEVQNSPANKKYIFKEKCTFKYPKGLKDTKYAKTTGVVPSLIF